jgi:hypothetical protein
MLIALRRPGRCKSTGLAARRSALASELASLAAKRMVLTGELAGGLAVAAAEARDPAACLHCRVDACSLPRLPGPIAHVRHVTK